MVEHLAKLGVTTIELMPIQAFFDDRYLVEKGLSNYWGYNTIGFFAPAPRYLMPGNDISEFKHMVQRMHEAGIEVILDVVYNHTAEGNQLGPTLSFKGLDNASYYVLADDPRYYFDTTGCGNTVNTRHPRVVQMVMDSLRYWVEDCHVDGFRFDLAVSLTRDRDAVDFNSPFLDAVTQDPVLAKVKMISESWDLGKWGYQVGSFPPGWAEWNGRFRDDIRAYVKGDEGTIDSFAKNLLGSGDIFDRRGRRPWASINFITAHDGFTLADLYAYSEKHNEANGEDNRDGHDDNRSWNCGAEGPTDDEGILDLRDRMRRFAMTTLVVSQGVPMVLMGDEIGRTQDGNNNGYCQDNRLAWMQWSPRAAGGSVLRVCCRRAGTAARTRPAGGAALGAGRSGEGGRPAGRALAAAGRRRRWPRPSGRTAAVKAIAVALANAEGAGALLLANASDGDVDFVLPGDRLRAGRGGCGSTAGRERSTPIAARIRPARPCRSPGGASCSIRCGRPGKVALRSRPSQRRERMMTKVVYEIVEHDGGWAYRVDGTFSEAFATRGGGGFGRRARCPRADGPGPVHRYRLGGRARPLAYGGLARRRPPGDRSRGLTAGRRSVADRNRTG